MARFKKMPQEKIERINLVPIMDAVFILIFFLLFSSNMMRIYELNLDIPLVSNTPPPKEEKKPLNLLVKISSKSVSFYTGVNESLKKTLYMKDKGYIAQVKSLLFSLKKINPDEKHLTVTAAKKTPYKDIVFVLDSIRSAQEGDVKAFESIILDSGE